MSSRGDFMPNVYVEHFSELQDNVPAHPVEEIKAVVTQSLLLNHGMKFDDVFDTFSDKPLGSASIGSVHAAILTDSFLKLNDSYSGGKEVAVKVMHFDAEDRFKNDFKILKVKNKIYMNIFLNELKYHSNLSVWFLQWLCRVALPGWSPILPELERQFMTEFDYLNEASSLQAVRRNMLASPYKNLVRIPEPLVKFSSKNVLFMEKLEGEKMVSYAERKLTEALGGDESLAKAFIDQRRKDMLTGETTQRTTKEEIQMIQRSISHFSIFDRLCILLRLTSLVLKQRKHIELLLDVHGYQIFLNGQFNGGTK